MVFDELLMTVTDGAYGGFCQRTVHVYRTCTSHRVAWTHKQVKFVSDNLKVIFKQHAVHIATIIALSPVQPWRGPLLFVFSCAR